MITYRNRHGDLYFLHEGRTRTGKPKYFFSRKEEGVLADSIPACFEVYENPNAQMFLRRSVPALTLDAETRTVTDAVRRNPKARTGIVEAKGRTITVFMPSLDPDAMADKLSADFPFADRARLRRILDRSVHFTPMMRFVLEDEKTREYQAERWCCSSGIDDWIGIGLPGPLPRLAREFCRHLGRESFFELM